MFSKLLIANRSEIACRIMRTAQKMGVSTVAVYSDADRNAAHTALADEAVHIGAAKPSESYLNIEKIIAAAVHTGAQAIHPGYGFLSENSGLAASCETRAIAFVGPASETIAMMASKNSAAQIATDAAVPTLAGYRDASQDASQMLMSAKQIGFPILLKSAMGGGGRGMRIVHREAEFEEAMISAKSEAIESFGDDEIIIEKYLQRARHIEVQILADSHGNIVHLFDRDCSAQRRYQKIIEEAPAIGIPGPLRARLHDAALAIAEVLGYCNAGTLEFLLDDDNFYFMEMNTRLQVEHPVTEQITGIDLVEWQLRIAAGESLRNLRPFDAPQGHSIEVRIYAENPHNHFLPSSGLVRHFRHPENSADVQVHTGVRGGDRIDTHYDPLIAKLVATAPHRPQAIEKMKNALHQVQIAGIDTNVNFLFNLLSHSVFAAAGIDIRFVEQNLKQLLTENSHLPEHIAILTALFLHAQPAGDLAADARQSGNDKFSPWFSAIGWRGHGFCQYSQYFEYRQTISRVSIRTHADTVTATCRAYALQAESIEIDGNDIVVNSATQRLAATVLRTDSNVVCFSQTQSYEMMLGQRYLDATGSTETSGSLLAPMAGRVVRVLVSAGQRVERQQTLMVIEAMKMEHQVRSPTAGIVIAVHHCEGDQIDEGVVCAVLEST